MAKRNWLRTEQLENRICLTVSAAVTDGNLIVRGDADGAVEIVEVSEDAYRLTDNSVIVAGAVASHLLVTGRDGAGTVTLAETASVDRSVRISLGSGDNTTTIAAAVDGSLLYSGGDGNDVFTVEQTATISDSLFARLGEGENSLIHNGTIEGDLYVTSSNDDDSVTVAELAVVGGDANLTLGEQTDRGEHHDHGRLRSLTYHGRPGGFSAPRRRG